MINRLHQDIKARLYEKPAEGPAHTEAGLLDGLHAKVDALQAAQQKMAADARARNRVDVREVLTDPSATTLDVPPSAGVKVRISYVVGYCQNTATLSLGGSALSPAFVLPVAAGTFAFVLGDERQGGLTLEPGDLRRLSNSGAASRMTLALFGELVPETQEV